jgi:hypothetical protein
MLLIHDANAPAPISLDAVLFSRSGRLPVRITALGDDRATVHSAVAPDSGSFAFLVRNGVKVAATVAWSAGDRLGLCFEEPLGMERRSAAFTAGRIRKPRFTSPLQSAVTVLG